MPAHRNAIFFPKQQPTYYNKTTINNNYYYGGGRSFGMGGLSIFAMVMPFLFSIPTMIMPFFNKNNYGGYSNPYAMFNNLWKKDKPEVNPDVKPKNDKTKGNPDKYTLDINSETTTTQITEEKMSKVPTIKYGGPWHYAQLYTDNEGNGLNINSPEFKALYAQLKGEMKEVDGDRTHMVLPKSITVNGKTYNLLSGEALATKHATLKGAPGGANATYSKVTTTTITRDVTSTKYGYTIKDSTGKVIKTVDATFASEAEAQAAADEYANSQHINIKA